MAAYRCTLPAQTAAGGDSTTICGGAVETTDDTDNTLYRVLLIPPNGFSTVTGVATDNATISVRQLRAGSLVATPASVTLGVGTNLVAEVPLVVPIVAAAAFQQDDVLEVRMHQNGAGIAIGAGVIAEVEISGR